MKRLLLFVFLLLVVITISAQVKFAFGKGNAKSIIALVLYEKENSDYFYKVENVEQDVLSVKDIKKYYAYDKKNKKLYAETQYGNYVIELEDSYANYYKKADVIPSLKEENIFSIVTSVNDKLKVYYDAENIKIKNSFIEKRRLDREKYVKDSIDKIEKQRAEREQYRKNNSWRKLKFSVPHTLECEICKVDYKLQHVNVLSLVEDTIYYTFNYPDLTILNNKMYGIHYSVLPYDAKRDIYFRDYIEMWDDSIANHEKMTKAQAILETYERFEGFKKDVRKQAPYGFVKKWGWELNSAYGVEPYFTFYNTSDKTIKYVDFYFSLFNAVGDRCFLKYEKSYVGNVRGVGPVETFQTGAWSWDRATHYTSGDASEMKIVKVVITYVDKTKKVLTGNALLFDNNR